VPSSDRPLVITLCTSRKRIAPKILASALPRGTQETVSAAWIRALRKASPEATARHLYAGRAFRDAARAADFLDGELAVASAGLGFVKASCRIPSYDLTISRGGIRRKIRGRFDARQWWRTVCSGPYGTDLERALKARPLVLACLSRAYLPFVVDALKKLSRERLRIFGAGLQSVLPPVLAECLLPYDDRLESLSPGTRADFAQRALLHYATTIYGGSQMTLEHDKAAVSNALEKVKPRPRGPKRPSAGDAAIRDIIRRLLPSIGKRRSVMLRHLRSVEGIACEQSRFNRLFTEVVK